jgi:hypothetical protein
VSPERARDGASTVESDLWSLGATLYAAVEGRSPFARESAMSTLMALATEEPDPPVFAGPLVPVLTGLLQREPSERLTATEVQEQLRAIVGPGNGPVLSQSTVGRKVTAGRAAVVPGPRRPVDDDRAPEPDAVAPNGKGAALATAPPPAASAAVMNGAAGHSLVRLTPLPRQSPPEVSAPLSRPRSHTGVLLAGLLAVLLVAGIGLTVTWIVRQRGDDQQSAQRAGNSPPPSAPPVGAVVAVSTFSAAACAGAAPANAPRTPQPGAKTTVDGFALLPSWHFYTDPTGYQVGVPDTWTYQKVGTTMCFRDPLGGRFLSVDPDRDPKGNPIEACRAEAARMVEEGALPQYTQISLQSVAPTIKAADWEYTYADPSGTRMHAVTRWFVSEGKAYALTWATRDFDWPANQSLRNMILGSFAG